MEYLADRKLHTFDRSKLLPEPIKSITPLEQMNIWRHNSSKNPLQRHVSALELTDELSNDKFNNLQLLASG